MPQILLDIMQNSVTPFLIYLILQVADVITTKRALARGGREANPAVAFMMGRLGKNGWVIVKGAVGLAAGVILLETGAVLVLWLLCAAYLFVAVNNIRAGS